MWSQFCFSNKHERFVCRVEASHGIKPNGFRRAKKIGNNALMSEVCDWRRTVQELNDNLDTLLDSAVDIKFMDSLLDNFMDAYSLILEQLNRLACRYMKML